MSGELEAAGTAIEGALLGTAVEGMRRQGGEKAEDNCLNCGARLTGAFCAACGQQAHVHRTLSAIGHDVLHSVFHFDGKLWRTLPMLLFKPGELTRRFIHGERAKFVSPMGLFLFAIFAMFAVFSFTGNGSGEITLPGQWQAGMKEEAQKLDAEIPKLQARLETAKAASPEAQALAAKLEDMKSERNGISFATTGKPYYGDKGERIPQGVTESMIYSDIDTGWKWLDNKLNNGGRHLLENPALAFYKLQSNGYKFAWLLIPLSLPFVWLVTLGVRGHRFYDHAVFTTYSISFMCILFIIASLAGWAGMSDEYLVPLFAIAPILHIYKQLRGAYSLSRLGALLRMILLMLSVVLVMTFFFIILLLLGLTG